MEIDFTQCYIIVRHRCEGTSLILTEHGEEHAQRAKERFWDILSLQKEQGSALNLAGSASDHAQGDIKKVLGYFVTNKRVRYFPLSLKLMLVMVPDSWCKLYLNITIASECPFMNNRYLYQEVDIDNVGPVWVSIWTLESFSVAITIQWPFNKGVICNKNVEDIETPNWRIDPFMISSRLGMLNLASFIRLPSSKRRLRMLLNFA